MEWLVMAAIVVVVLAGISVMAYLKRIATAAERIADALEVHSLSGSSNDRHP
jgi:hypothetical protein